MGIKINHDARKQAIVTKAIQLFATQGYNGVTYQKIADRCGIARTTLYRYFKNKRAIFNTAIWELSSLLITHFDEILQAEISALEKLERVSIVVIELLHQQRTMLMVILDYVLSAQRAGQNLSQHITRHTIGLRRILLQLVIAAIHAEEIHAQHPNQVVDLIYTQFEATILRLTVSRNADQKRTIALLQQTLKSFKLPKK